MGWWFRRRSAQQGAQQPGASAPDPEGLELALDTVGVFLQEYGRNAFDTDSRSARDVRETCQAWLHHLLAGGPRPGDEGVPDPVPLGRRDWKGVRQFFAGQRRDECRYVHHATGGFRDIVWNFVQVLDEVIAQDQDSDHRIHAQLRRLRAAAQEASPEMLRREVASVAAEIGRIALERKRRQDERLASLHGRVKQLGEQLAVARRESALDPLTGIHNRRGLEERLSQAITMHRLFGQPASLLLVDLDHFKRINDTYGHLAGDEVLRAVARCLSVTFRVRDDFVARFGGEEFAVILWNITPGHAVSSARRLLEAIRTLRVPYKDAVLCVTASIGLARVSPEDTPERWLGRADRALYEAKRRGRDCVVPTDLDGALSAANVASAQE